MMHLGPARATGSPVPHTHDLDDLELDDEGYFRVILSPSAAGDHTGDWWPLDPRTKRLLMRKCSCDWTNEIDARVAIERLDDARRRHDAARRSPVASPTWRSGSRG